MTENNTFFALKLATGETLFAEVTKIAEKQVTIRKPLHVKDVQMNGDGAMVAQPWLYYIEDDTNIPLPADMIYLFEPLSKKFIKFYGGILMQQEIQKIKNEVIGDLEEGQVPDYYTLTEAVNQINEASEYMTMKFGIERVDTSGFTNAAAKQRPMMH